MTSRKTRELLLFLALLLAWGEAVAAPWLVCLHQHSQVVAQESGPQAALHAAAEAPLSHSQHHDNRAMHAAAPTVHADVVAVEQAGPALQQLHATTDCDDSCAFCRGMNLPDLVTPLGTGAPLLLPWSSAAPLLTVAVPPPVDHFRPPAVG